MDSGASCGVFTVQRPAVCTTSLYQSQSHQPYQIQVPTTSVLNANQVSSAQFQIQSVTKPAESIKKFSPVVTKFQTVSAKQTLPKSVVIPSTSSASNYQQPKLISTPIQISNNNKPSTNKIVLSDDLLSFETLVNGKDSFDTKETTSSDTDDEATSDEELLNQLTELLEQVTSVPLNPENKVVQQTAPQPTATVESSLDAALEDILSMEDYDHQVVQSTMLSSVSEYCATLKKEHLLQSSGHSPRSVSSCSGSDSDYESIHSPSSDTAETGAVHPTSFDCSSFDELFPTLA